MVVNGWKAAGIYDAIEMGSAKLPPLDPFLQIDGIVIHTNDFNSTPQFPEKDHPDVNSRDGGDESEYELWFDFLDEVFVKICDWNVLHVQNMLLFYVWIFPIFT